MGHAYPVKNKIAPMFFFFTICTKHTANQCHRYIQNTIFKKKQEQMGAWLYSLVLWGEA